MNTGLIWSNLATYSLQIGLLVGIAAFVPTLLRLRLPGARLAYWHILLATCLLLPIVRPWRQEVIAVVGIQAPAPVIAPVPLTNPISAPSIPRSEIALFLLLAGTAVRLGWLGLGFWRLRQYRRHATPLYLDGGVPAFLSDEISSPVTFGIHQPVVLLPKRFPSLDRRLQDAILCHEMMHIERGDWLFTVGEEIVRAIFWFHPAIWWLLGEIQLAREQAVDSQVIEKTQARDEYVDALLAIAGANPRLDLAPAPLFLRKRHLKQRVIAILKEVRMSKTRMVSRLALSLGVLAAGCWFVTATFPLAAAPQMSNDAPGVSVDLGAAALLHRAPVSYPEAARKAGIQGTVMVEAKLDGSGNVMDARVLSGPEELRRAALQSVLQWHFRGGAAGATQQVGITFRLPAANQAPAVEPKPELRVFPQPPSGVLSGPAQDRAQKLIEEMRRGPGGRVLKGITVSGLSDQMREDLLARLPVHEGDVLADDSLDKVRAVLKEFDEHMVMGTMLNGTNEARITLSSPNSVSQGSALQGSASVKTDGPKLVRQVAPVYPPLAKQARISGVVKFSAVIAADGTVKHIEVISGHPLLVGAAIEALKQWVYQPTLLNGAPVEVSTQIDITFSLSDQ